MNKNHLLTLHTKKSKLAQAIAEELKRPLPDSIKIGELKRQKLALTEEINTYTDLTATGT